MNNVYVYNTILRPLNMFTDFFDICHVEMFVYDYINFGQLSVKDCVSYNQCLNSLRTALVCCGVCCLTMYIY